MAAARSSSTTSWVLVRSDSTTLGVNALDTRPRNLVWSGGSRKRNGRISSMAAATGSSSAMGVRNPWGIRSTATLRLSELALLSRRMARQSAWRETTQNPRSFLWMGARSRRSAYREKGSLDHRGSNGSKTGLRAVVSGSGSGRLAGRLGVLDHRHRSYRPLTRGGSVVRGVRGSGVRVFRGLGRFLHATTKAATVRRTVRSGAS